MKNLFFILSISITVNGLAQYSEIRSETKKIVEQRTISLNSTARAAVGGKSRVVIPFDLPNNCTEWYYSFSTSPNESGTKNLNLAIQLSSLLLDETGSTAKLLSMIEVPPGSGSADIYILDQNNQLAFMEKWDKNGGSFNYLVEGTTLNTNQGVVRIDDVTKGRYFLGLNNPSGLNGLTITIEVTAIVHNKVYIDEWVTSSISNIKMNCLSYFKTEGIGKENVCSCVESKITSAYSPSKWENAGEVNRESFKSSALESCFNETNNLPLKEAEISFREEEKKRLNAVYHIKTSIYTLRKEALAAEELANYAEAEVIMRKAIDLVFTNKDVERDFKQYSTLSEMYNSLAWYTILQNKLDITYDALKKGLALSPNNMYLWGNMGNYHLLKQDYASAERAFTKFKRKDKLSNGEKWVEVIASDLNTLEALGYWNQDFERVRELLKIKK